MGFYKIQKGDSVAFEALDETTLGIALRPDTTKPKSPP